MPPDQLFFDGFEERLDSGIVVAVAFATHGSLEAVLTRDFLVVVRTILGGFNRSSQHPFSGGVHDDRKTKVRKLYSAKIMLSRTASGLAT